VGNTLLLKQQLNARHIIGALQISIGLVVVLDSTGIAYFLRWLSGTDWLFGHTQGNPLYIIAALWSVDAGVLGTGLWVLIAVYQKFMFPVESRQRHSKWRFVQPILLVLLLMPTGIIVAITVTELPRARLQVEIRHVESGADRGVEVPWVLVSLEDGRGTREMGSGGENCRHGPG